MGVPAFFLLKQSGNVSLAAIGMMIIMLPMFFLGMYEKHGQPLEVIAKQFIEAKFYSPESPALSDQQLLCGADAADVGRTGGTAYCLL